jgi:DNA-binding PadR family transcriptional regulator
VKHISSPAARAPEPLGEFEQLVLFALVRLGDDAYGATIRREIETRTGRELAISAVYVTVARLEAKGLVRTRVGDPSPTRGGRRRKHVSIAPAGRRAIAHAYHQFRVMAEGLETEFGR